MGSEGGSDFEYLPQDAFADNLNENGKRRQKVQLSKRFQLLQSRRQIDLT